MRRLRLTQEARDISDGIVDAVGRLFWAVVGTVALIIALTIVGAIVVMRYWH